MTDPYELRTARQRAFVMAAIIAYFVLFAVQVVTGNPAATALSDLVIAALAIPSSVVVLRRATAPAETNWLAAITAVAFLVAGLVRGYVGLAFFTELETITAVDVVGSGALLVALVLYLYQTWS